MLGMRFLPKLGCGANSCKDSEETGAMKNTLNSVGDGGEELSPDESNLLKTVGWVSAALGAVALGLIVGRELRERYKFNRRTPYDLYSHSGDELPDVDCGVGI
jgi:hypothetical protein